MCLGEPGPVIFATRSTCITSSNCSSSNSDKSTTDTDRGSKRNLSSTLTSADSIPCRKKKKKPRLSKTSGSASSSSRNRVKFREELEVHCIPSREELNEETKLQCWFPTHVLKAIKRKAINQMNKHTHTKDADPNFCRRGLERRSKTGSAMFRSIKKRAFRAVIAEQWRQKCLMPTSSRKNGDVVISQIYQRATGNCLEEARERGIQDEEEANQIYLLLKDEEKESDAKVSSSSNSSSNSGDTYSETESDEEEEEDRADTETDTATNTLTDCSCGFTSATSSSCSCAAVTAAVATNEATWQMAAAAAS